MHIKMLQMQFTSRLRIGQIQKLMKSQTNNTKDDPLIIKQKKDKIN